MQEGPSLIDALPLEFVVSVMSYIDPCSFYAVICACRVIYSTVEMPAVWNWTKRSLLFDVQDSIDDFKKLTAKSTTPGALSAVWDQQFLTWCKAGMIPCYMDGTVMEHVMKHVATEFESEGMQHIFTQRRVFFRDDFLEVGARDEIAMDEESDHLGHRGRAKARVRSEVRTINQDNKKIEFWCLDYAIDVELDSGSFSQYDQIYITVNDNPILDISGRDGDAQNTTEDEMTFVQVMQDGANANIQNSRVALMLKVLGASVSLCAVPCGWCAPYADRLNAAQKFFGNLDPVANLCVHDECFLDKNGSVWKSQSGYSEDEFSDESD